jgi:NAD(P)-dependent dehydrogenase (short-subunit alcohol dehydrogenase family)
MSDFLGLQGRVAIVTGAGRGIGRATAGRFAAFGAIPIIAERDAVSGEAAAAALREAGHDALAIATDVSDPASVEALARQVEARYGRIDILVNNAALFADIPLTRMEDIDLATWDRIMRVNINGPFLCSQAVMPTMRRAKWGRIVNISSNTVASGRPFYLHYITSKSALVGMTRSMARELGPDNILVNAVMPALTRHEKELAGSTDEMWQRSIDQQCLKRTSTPDELTDAILFLCSDAARFITGQTIAVDGGLVHR